MASDELLPSASSHPSLDNEPEPSAMDHDILTHEEEVEEPQIQLTIHHHGKPHEVSLPASWTLSDLSNHIAEHLHIPASNQKFMITPKVGTLRPPFATDHPLSSLASKKIVLMGSSTAEISDLSSRLKSASAPRKASPIKPATAAKHRDWKRAKEESTYTFHQIAPLPYLPNPAKSQKFLERLAHDAGIVASMRKHKFAVGLLTEMDPAQHTTHESRTLGLNRNRGEVIELRLRTDASDGYRDYKTIRKTLCHELAHNVWGEHDRNFWELTKEIEREVERNDWTRGGHSVGAEEFYNPQDEGVGDEHVDAGGWEGGTYVLGGSGSAPAEWEREGLSRREAIMRAVEERLKRLNDISRPPSPEPEGEGKEGGAEGKRSASGREDTHS